MDKFSKDNTELDDIAYHLYLQYMWEKDGIFGKSGYWDTQHHFRMREDTKKYYEQANIILRKRKLDKIKNGI